MTEYVVFHIENDLHYVLDTWAKRDEAVAHLQTVIDTAWGEGAIVSIPCVGGKLAQDRAHVEVVDSGALGEYDVRIVPVRVIVGGA